MAIPKRIKIERVYVKVASEFDSTGYMQPTIEDYLGIEKYPDDI